MAVVIGQQISDNRVGDKSGFRIYLRRRRRPKCPDYPALQLSQSCARRFCRPAPQHVWRAGIPWCERPPSVSPGTCNRRRSQALACCSGARAKLDAEGAIRFRQLGACGAVGSKPSRAPMRVTEIAHRPRRASARGFHAQNIDRGRAAMPALRWRPAPAPPGPRVYRQRHVAGGRPFGIGQQGQIAEGRACIDGGADAWRSGARSHRLRCRCPAPWSLYSMPGCRNGRLARRRRLAPAARRARSARRGQRRIADDNTDRIEVRRAGSGLPHRVPKSGSSGFRKMRVNTARAGSDGETLEHLGSRSEVRRVSPAPRHGSAEAGALITGIRAARGVRY